MNTSNTKFPIPPISTSSRINVGSAERMVSLVGGAVLTYLGLKKFSLSRLGLAATGGTLLYRGLTGHCPINAEFGRDTSKVGRGTGPIEVKTSLTVDKPRNDVYAFWRQLETLPRFMRHLAEVRDLGEGRSHWTARAPKGAVRVEWDAKIQSEEDGRQLTWRSVEGAAIDNAGEVRFEDAPGGRGTEVHARIMYRPPAGDMGEAAAQLFNPVFEQMVKEDIRRFKHILEAGETPTSATPSS
jgi:uncharacterized membrane protein